MIHPRDALFDADEALAPLLPVVDHYCGSEKLMRKSLALQAQRQGAFDVTLDCEDGATVGDEAKHVALVTSLLQLPQAGRVGVRVHPVDHPAFQVEINHLIAHAGPRIAYVMLPKLESLAQLSRGADAIARAWQAAGWAGRLPLHGLIESHSGLREVDAIAAHPAIESLSFGLMDFVSAHRGAIPASAMGAEGQFSHPLVLRAKLAISAACHGHGKVPSHCVVTELNDPARLAQAARRAVNELGYTRIWSIHPAQIDPLLAAFAPTAEAIREAADILCAAQDAQWGPTRHRDQLHDRASYRFFWHTLARAHQTGTPLPDEVRVRFFTPLTH